MKDLDQHKKIAVLIDADNAQYSRLKLILDELSTHGHIVVKRAYGDWSSECLKNWKGPLNELAIQPVQQFAYTVGKNATDASMIIAAMEMLYSGKFDAFALVSSDSDFTKLAARLRESEMVVYGVGQKKTPTSFRNACDNFILTENLGDEPEAEAADMQAIADNLEAHIEAHRDSQIIHLLTRGWKNHQDDDGWANVSLVGNFVKRSTPDFDPRTYGATKITEVISKFNKNFQLKRNKGKNGANLVMFRPLGKNVS